jgi:hypothetical protein
MGEKEISKKPNKEISPGKAKKDKLKESLRTRLHFWLCDRFNIVSANDFVIFYDDVYNAFKHVQEKFKNVDKFEKSQIDLDRVIADKLKIKMLDDEKKKVECNDRGMFG